LRERRAQPARAGEGGRFPLTCLRRKRAVGILSPLGLRPRGEGDFYLSRLRERSRAQLARAGEGGAAARSSPRSGARAPAVPSPHSLRSRGEGDFGIWLLISGF